MIAFLNGETKLLKRGSFDRVKLPIYQNAVYNNLNRITTLPAPLSTSTF
jgi:hypothetical protein